jgi:uncharacterized protein
MKPPLIALLASGALAPLAAAPQVPAPGAAPPLIRVTGDARVTAKPDRVQIDLGVTNRATSSQQAAAENARQADAVLAAVRSAGGAGAQLKTVNYSITPHYQYHQNGGEPTLDGYTATNIVQVTLDDLTKVGTVIDSATRAGSNQVQGIRFTLRDQDAVRASALREAATRARAEADVLAAALGLKVVRVLSVEESGPGVTPQPLYAGVARQTAAMGPPTPVEAGTLDVTANVTLTVEVAPAAR